MVYKPLASLRNAEQHSDLQFSPGELDFTSIILVICFFIARTIKHSLGFGTAFQRLQNGQSSMDSSENGHEQLYALPDLSLSMPFRLNASQYRTFTDAVGNHGKAGGIVETNSAQLSLFLAAASEPALLLLLAKRGCPIRPLGAVNVRNRFEILDPRLCRTIVHGSKSSNQGSTDLSVLAKFPRPARRVRRGLEIDVEVSIVTSQSQKGTAQGSSTSEAKAIFRQEFTMLQFMKFETKSTTASASTPGTAYQQQSSRTAVQSQDIVSVTMSMSSEAPYVWASLCKDYNPIHFSSVLAKLLGQPGQLAHGNHAVGVCVQTLSQTASASMLSSQDAQRRPSGDTLLRHFMHDKLEGGISPHQRFWMEVRFKRPIVLPATIESKLHTNQDGFDVVDPRTGKVHIEADIGLV